MIKVDSEFQDESLSPLFYFDGSSAICLIANVIDFRLDLCDAKWNVILTNSVKCEEDFRFLDSGQL